MKWIKLFKQFEAREEDDSGELNFNDEESAFQDKMQRKEFLKRNKVSPIQYSKTKFDSSDWRKGWSPIKYTDVPLDVYLQRKKLGTENSAPKQSITPEEQHERTIDNIKWAIADCDGMFDFKRHYYHLWQWANKNLDKTGFNTLFDDLIQKDLVQQKFKEKEKGKIAKREEERRKQEEKRRKEQESIDSKMRKITRRNTFNDICDFALDKFQYYDTFKIFYPEYVKWLIDNDFLKEFLNKLEFGDKVSGLVNKDFDEKEIKKLSKLGFMPLQIGNDIQSKSIMTKKTAEGRNVKIFSLILKDIRKEVYLVKINDETLPLKFLETIHSGPERDLEATLRNLKSKLRLEHDSFE